MNLTVSKKNLTLVGTVITATIVGLFLLLILQTRPAYVPSISPCLPTFRDGGGPYYQANAPFREKIVPDENEGVPMVISGYVVSTDCNSVVPGATVDIWQANESGDYEDEWYRGQVTADQNGFYSFETVMPKGYEAGSAFRPPHIHFKVHVNGAEIVTSQMFFEDVRGQDGFNDEYIVKIDSQSDQKITATHHLVLPDFD